MGSRRMTALLSSRQLERGKERNHSQCGEGAESREVIGGQVGNDVGARGKENGVLSDERSGVGRGSGSAGTDQIVRSCGNGLSKNDSTLEFTPVGKGEGAAVGEGSVDRIGGVFTTEGVHISAEGSAFFGASETYKQHVVGEGEKGPINVDGRDVDGEALGGGDRLGFMTAGTQGGGGGLSSG